MKITKASVVKRKNTKLKTRSKEQNAEIQESADQSFYSVLQSSAKLIVDSVDDTRASETRDAIIRSICLKKNLQVQTSRDSKAIQEVLSQLSL